MYSQSLSHPLAHSPRILGFAVACALIALSFSGGATIEPARPIASHQGTPPVFRTGVQTVAVYATVRDGAGRLVTNLTRDDFQILDNGSPAEIRTFSNEILPFTAVLLL